MACSRRVRRETELGQLSVSVASLALQKVRKHFGAAGPRCAAVVGVGDMTRKVALTLGRERACDLLVVNRTLARAEELAAECGGRAVSLEAFQAAPPPDLELVFTATSSPVPVIGPQTLAPALAARQGPRPLIVCDLGIPRDSDPALDQTPGVAVITLPRMEQLAAANRARLADHVARAQAIVTEAAARSLREQRFTALAQTSVQGLLSKRLAHLDPSDQGGDRQVRRQPGSTDGPSARLRLPDCLASARWRRRSRC